VTSVRLLEEAVAHSQPLTADGSPAQDAVVIGPISRIRLRISFWSTPAGGRYAQRDPALHRRARVVAV